MRIGDIEEALGEHLANIYFGPRIAWANKAKKPEKPYFQTLHAPVSQIEPALDGSVPPDSLGLFLITLVTDGDVFTTEANNLAQDVADHFRQGTRIPATGGVVLVDRVAIVGGFHDAASNWVVPIRINYRTET